MKDISGLSLFWLDLSRFFINAHKKRSFTWINLKNGTSVLNLKMCPLSFCPPAPPRFIRQKFIYTQLPFKFIWNILFYNLG